MNLILSGGGTGKQSQKADSLFTSLLKTSHILYLPIAMDENEISYPDCYKWCESNLSQYGDYKITMWTEKDLYENSYEDLINFGGILIGGGNSFHLLNEFRKSKFDKYIKRLLKNTDIPVMGGSAGALIFSKSIDTAIPYDKNNINLTDLSGLNLVNDYHLWVHYDESMNEKISEYCSKLKSKIIAIPEDSGLYIYNDKIIVTGENKVIVFPSKNEFKEEEKIN